MVVKDLKTISRAGALTLYLSYLTTEQRADVVAKLDQVIGSKDLAELQQLELQSIPDVDESVKWLLGLTS